MTDRLCSWLQKTYSCGRPSGNGNDGQGDASAPLPLGVKGVRLAALGVALVACAAQLHRSYGMSDQSHAYYFRNYAQALLEPLPPSAVLLINYDMQWTSVRYMQKCEGLRPDVTVINLSMMTYQWFQSKRHLYPHLVFPGAYHSYEKSSAVKSGVAFTLSQFLDANIHTHQIFLSGKLSFRDSVFDSKYEHIPHGLVSQIEEIDKLPNGTAYSRSIRPAWQVSSVSRILTRATNL